MNTLFLFKKYTSVVIFLFTLFLVVEGRGVDNPPITFGGQRSADDENKVLERQAELKEKELDKEYCTSKEKELEKTINEITSACAKAGLTPYSTCKERLDECSDLSEWDNPGGVSAMGIQLLPNSNSNRCSDMEKKEKDEKIKDLKKELEDISKDITKTNDEFKEAQEKAAKKNQEIRDQQNDIDKQHNEDLKRMKEEKQQIAKEKLTNESSISKQLMENNNKIAELFSNKSQAIQAKSSELIGLTPNLIESSCKLKAAEKIKTINIIKSSNFVGLNREKKKIYKEQFEACYKKFLLDRSNLIKNTNEVIYRIDDQIANLEKSNLALKKQLSLSEQQAKENEADAIKSGSEEQRIYWNKKMNLIEDLQLNQKTLQDAQNKKSMDLWKSLGKQNQISNELANLQNTKVGDGNFRKINENYGALNLAKNSLCSKEECNGNKKYKDGKKSVKSSHCNKTAEEILEDLGDHEGSSSE